MDRIRIAVFVPAVIVVLVGSPSIGSPPQTPAPTVDFASPVFISISDLPWALADLGDRVDQRYGVQPHRVLGGLFQLLPDKKDEPQPFPKSVRGVVLNPSWEIQALYSAIPKGVTPEDFLRTKLAAENNVVKSIVHVEKSGSVYTATCPVNKMRYLTTLQQSSGKLSLAAKVSDAFSQALVTTALRFFEAREREFKRKR